MLYAHHLYIDGQEITDLIIPNSVTSIGNYAFDQCAGLTSATIGKKVSSIGNAAFAGCNNLTTIKCSAKVPPTCYSNSFYDVNKTSCILEVPENKAAVYKAATYWKDFKKIREIVYDKSNTLSMNDLSVYRNTQIVIPIALENENEITAFQFDLYLPAGISVAKNSRGKLLISTTDRMDGNYTITGNEMNGFTRVLGYSSDTDAFTGNSGDFLNITLDISDEIEAGSYLVEINDITLSDVNNNDYYPADVESTFKVRQYTIADVDANGAFIYNLNMRLYVLIKELSEPVFLQRTRSSDLRRFLFTCWCWIQDNHHTGRSRL